MELDAQVQAAAERLRQAETLGRPCPPVRDLVGDDPAAGRAVQRHVLALRSLGGAVRVGGKVGRSRDVTGTAVHGVLLDEMRLADESRIATSLLLRPRVELKLALTLTRDLAADLAADVAATGPGSLRDAVVVSAALEVADCRIRGADLSLVDEIADNAGAGLFVLGPGDRAPADLPDQVPVRLEVDGELTWHGSVALETTLVEVAGLARAWAAAGMPLQVGDTVLAAAVGPTWPALEGHHCSAHVADLPPATVGLTSSATLVPTRGAR